MISAAPGQSMTPEGADPGIRHAPVMPGEVLALLDPKPGDTIVDATVGMGGHATLILERIGPGGLLIGLDRDRSSLERVRPRLAPYGDAVRLLHENFKNLPLVLHNLHVGPIDGLLADLGISSWQMLTPERGFSFQSAALLDMRIDQSQRLTAADVVNNFEREELADLIRAYGEEPKARRIAAAIATARETAPVTRCSQLAEIVARAASSRHGGGIHPATRTFQALRIYVNRELEGLDRFLEDAAGFLKNRRRLAVIAFHSLEDRVVKRTFRMLAGQCVCERPRELCTCPRRERVRILTPRPTKPAEAELAVNPRSRSARLRAVERTEEA